MNTCPKCGHTFWKRVEHPRRCPGQCGQKWPQGKPKKRHEASRCGAKL